MQQGRARVVVGEGRAARKGLLRFVLEGEGFDVVGEAPDAAELAKLLAVEQPDVVVLDDGIGVTAVQLTHEVAPAAKVVLVWPGAVVPIGGDARVEPSEVLRGLGPAVSQVAGLAGLLQGFDKPDWIDKVRKDPATLRELLAKRSAEASAERPSVTELQKRAQRAEPTQEREPVPAAAGDDDTEHLAPVLILPTAAGAEPTIVLPPAVVAASAPPASPAHLRDEDEQDEAVAGVAAVAAVGAAATSLDPVATEFNRRLGTIALGGAALIGAIVLSLGVSASRVPVSVVNANPSVITTSSPPPPPPSQSGGGPSSGPTYPPKPPTGNQTHAHHGGPGPVVIGTTSTPGTGGGGSGGQNGGQSGGGGGNGGGGGGGGQGGGGGNGGGGGGGGTQGGDTSHGKAHQHHGHNDDPTPGHSGEHNPHGGPPGHQDPKPSGPPPKTMQRSASPARRLAVAHGHKR